MKRSVWMIFALFFGLIMVSGCSMITEGVGSITDAWNGTSKPDTVVADDESTEVPEALQCSAGFDRVFDAAEKICRENGIFEEDRDSGRIVTNERDYQKNGFFKTMVLIKPEYRVTEYINIKKSETGVEVSHKARFTEIRSKLLTSSNKDYPEAERALRKEFFDRMKAELALE